MIEPTRVRSVIQGKDTGTPSSSVERGASERIWARKRDCVHPDTLGREAWRLAPILSISAHLTALRIWPRPCRHRCTRGQALLGVAALHLERFFSKKRANERADRHVR